MKNNRDLTGERFGKLVVTGRAPTNGAGGHTRWDCKCDCGRETVVERSNLLKAGGIHSCGKCGVEHDMANERAYFRLAKSGAASRGLEFALTFEEYLGLVSQDCTYCGEAPKLRNTAGNPNRSKRYAYIMNGLDRVDSSKGYIRGNVVPCCWTCNERKKAMSVEEFLAWIRRVYAHSCMKEL